MSGLGLGRRLLCIARKSSDICAQFVQLILKGRHPLQLHIEFTIDLVDLALDDCEQFDALACGNDSTCRPLRACCAPGSPAADRPPFAGKARWPLLAGNAWWPLLAACAFGAGHQSK
jgi:hypothetical protein